MSHRLRLLAAGLSVALTGGALAAAPSPASAAPTQVIDYSCQKYLLGLPTGGAFDLPISVNVLDTVTVPVGGTVGTISGSVGLTGLTQPIADLLRSLLVGAHTLTFTLAGAAYGANLNGTSLSLPPLQVPDAPGSYQLLAPAQFDLSKTLGGILTSVTCGVADVNRVVSTLVAQAPAAPNSGGSQGTAGTVGNGGTAAAVDPTKPNPCVATPARKAGQRATRMKASAAKVSWKKRPAVKLTVKANGRVAKGTVIACYGAMKIGQRKLRKGKATLKTLRFYPGRYRVKVVYLGSAKARPRAKTITLRVKR